MDDKSYQLIIETLAANQFTSRLQLKLLFNTNIGSNERDGTFSGKHKTVFHYFVLDLTAVTLGFDFFPVLNIKYTLTEFHFLLFWLLNSLYG